MADSSAFDFVSDALEESTALSRLEARGTLRLALRATGVDAGSATRDQMAVLLRRVLPRELASRGIDGRELCSELIRRLAGADIHDSETGDSPEDVFRRLGG